LIDIGGGGICFAKIWSTLALACMSIISFSCYGQVSFVEQNQIGSVSLYFLENDFNHMLSLELGDCHLNSLI
jgi:hypothetical protein